jgi:acyl carrier protein
MKSITVEKEAFLNLIQNIFEAEVRTSIGLDTNLHQLSEWSSLQAMLLVSEIDNQYNIILSANEMKEANTIEKLLEKVMQKLS